MKLEKKMSLTEKEVRKIAKLSRIRLTDEEVVHFGKEISGILNWIEMLQEVNTDNVPRMASVSNISLQLRDDAVTDGNYRDAVLANAPDARYGCFAVPKVVE
jgi:aspartyl-tRNA(Asn)/glutamyl-tRNA(Gln) amidotransferase subunit C